jgi:hypothetical protein
VQPCKRLKTLKTKFLHSNTPTSLETSKRTPYQASYAPQNKHQEVKQKKKDTSPMRTVKGLAAAPNAERLWEIRNLD